MKQFAYIRNYTVRWHKIAFYLWRNASLTSLVLALGRRRYSLNINR